MGVRRLRGAPRRRPADHPFAARPSVGGPGRFAVRAIAHRGGGGELENTLPAFARAADLGYGHLETDVHATADGVLVVSHDPTLARVAGDPRAIADLTAIEVAAVRVAGREPLPTFSELLASFPTARFTVDLKDDRAVAPMVRLLSAQPALLDRLCLGAFSTARTRALREAFGARAYTAASPGEVLRLATAVRLGRRPGRLAADCVAVPERMPVGRLQATVGDVRLFGAARELGLDVHVWTVNDVGTMRRLVAAGVDGIVTDELEVLRDVLVDLERWDGGTSSR
jgi:glycerophosphoryl diester phosphodiesterase